MYKPVHKRSSASLSRASSDSVPFSWSLFALAIFHLCVWSLGTGAIPAQSYFSTHTDSLKTCGAACQVSQVSAQDIAIAQKQQEEFNESCQQAIRVIAEREAANTLHAASLTQQANLPVGGSTQLASLVLLTSLGGNTQSPESAAAAGAPAAPARQVCV